MSNPTTIYIRCGDSDTLTETISNITSLSGYTAKMYIYNGTTLYATLTGTIADLVVTYDIVNEVSKLWDAGAYNFETKVYDASDHVYTPSYGCFVVETAYNKDPS
jgi:hypothetical protein